MKVFSERLIKKEDWTLGLITTNKVKNTVISTLKFSNWSLITMMILILKKDSIMLLAIVTP